MRQCFRFFDSETYFDERGINILVRSLQENKMLDRLQRFEDAMLSVDVGRERMYQ